MFHIQTIGCVSVMVAVSVLGCSTPSLTNEGTSADAVSSYASEVVTSIGPWTKISVSDARSCAIREDGSAACWGAKYEPVLTSGGFSVPELARGGTLELGPAHDVVASSLTEFTYHHALRLTNCAKGSGGLWQCPRFTTDALPADLLPPMEPLTKIVLGSAVQCGLRPDKSIACWGRHSNDPRWAPPAGAFRDLAIDYDAACAIRDPEQTLLCWGERPPQLVPAGQFAEVMGSFHYDLICGLRLDGAFDCASPTSRSELAVRGTTDDPFHRELPPAMRFAHAGLGTFNACGIRQDTKEIFCWGHKRQDATDRVNGLIRLAPPGRFKDLSVSAWHACAIREDDALVCWGDERVGLGKPRDLGIFRLPQ